MGYKLAIADDERLIRESLAQFISWEELGFDLVLTAEDGQPVIDALEHGRLDAVLCDIQMQEKSGLDVAEFISRNEIDCIVVLLSGYEEFEYARKAIAYNVSEYLSKPINLGRIRQTFQRVKEELDKRAKEKQAWERLREKESFFRHAAVEQMMEKGMTGVLDDRQSCRAFLQKFGVDERILDWFAYLMKVKISRLDEYETFGRDILYNILKLLAGSEEMEDILMIYEKEEDEFRVLLLRRTLLQDSGAAYLEEVAKAVRDIFGTQAEAVFEAGAISLEEMMRYLGGSFSAVDDGRQKPVNKEAYLDMIAKQYLVILNMCTGAEEAGTCLDRICEQQHSSIQTGADQKEILKHMYRLLRVQFPDREITAPEHPDLLNKGFREVMEQYYNCLNTCGNDAVSLVERVKRLVKDHAGENISLSAAAEYVFLSPNYFSRVFKEQAGENFSEYGIRIKMEKAAEMIKDPGKKVYEIGEELGYHNIKYFYKLFKRTYNCTPLEYRERCGMEQKGR